MEVILRQRVEKLGQMGDVVQVKPGYARNYLIPKGIAFRATKEKMEEFQSQRVQLEAQNLKLKKEAEAVAKKMEGISVVLISQAGESGHLYGSIRAKDIADSLGEAGFTLHKNQIHIHTPLKTLGLHKVHAELHPEVIVEVVVNIALSPEEAEVQAKAAQAPTQKDSEKEAKKSKPKEEEVESSEASEEAQEEKSSAKKPKKAKE